MKDDDRNPFSQAFTHLECSRCRHRHKPTELQTICQVCNSPETLLAQYDYDSVRRSIGDSFPYQALQSRKPDLWRYHEMLPITESPVRLGEGFTPLLKADAIEAAQRVKALWIKDESVNPTGSFKARGMAVAVAMAKALGATRLALPSAGNAGGAAAAYGARAGLPVDIFLPAWTPQPFIFEAKMYGAEVHLVEGDIADCGAQVKAGTEEHRWFDLSTLKEPYRLEGKKTMGYELVEQFEGKLPDAIIYPTGGGTGLIGMWKAFKEMQALNWIRQDQALPKMIVVQAEGCAPMVRAFKSEAERATRWENPTTFASGLRVPMGIGDHLILQAIRESKGMAVALSDQAMHDAQLEIMQKEGVFAAPEGGATLAALSQLLDEGFIKATDRVVLFNTGTGLKYPDPPQ